MAEDKIQKKMANDPPTNANDEVDVDDLIDASSQTKTAVVEEHADHEKEEKPDFRWDKFSNEGLNSSSPAPTPNVAEAPSPAPKRPPSPKREQPPPIRDDGLEKINNIPEEDRKPPAITIPRVVKVSVSKERKEDRVGVTFRLQNSENGIVIHGISPDSLFVNTDLRVGMTVQSINELSANSIGSLKQAMQLLRDAEDVVTFVATGVGEPGAGVVPTQEEEEPINEDIVASATSPANATPGPSRKAREPSLIVVPQDSIEAADDYPSGAFPLAAVVECDCDELAEPDAIPITSTSSYAQGRANYDRMVVTVTATKPTPESLTGLGLKDHPEEAGVVISSISPSSIFYGAALREGFKILSVNDTDCQFLCKQAVAALLRSYPGRVTIRAVEVDLPLELAVATATPAASRATPAGDGGVLTTVTVIKPRQDSRVGIGISDRPLPFRIRPNAVPIITTIAPDGLCGQTSLETNMRVLSINGVSCRGRDDAVAMLRMAPRQVTILASHDMDMVAATVTKYTMDTKVGLNMTVKKGELVVSALPENGLFAQTDLREGMQILRINGVEVRNLPSNEVLGIVAPVIAQATGNVTVLAR